MKKLLSLITVFAISVFGISANASDKTLVGTTVLKDNLVYINGNSIPAAQLPNEYVYVCVEDLAYYGFTVDKITADGRNTYIVKKSDNSDIFPTQTVSDNTEINVYTTNSEVFLDSDTPANTFELEDGTVLIQSDELAKYGTYNWNADTHKISINFGESMFFPMYQTFCNVIGISKPNDIKYGTLVSMPENKCADIDSDDLKEWLGVYWNFEYNRVIAPLSAYSLTGNYVKLWNEDKSISYTVYPNGGIIVGKYGEPYQTHGEIRQNYVWYLPIIGNSRNALLIADSNLNSIYFDSSFENHKDRERAFTKDDEAALPNDDVLVLSGASDWAKAEINKAAACNILVYDLSQNYTQPITRYDFCRLAYRLIATEFRPDTDSRTGVEFAVQDIAAERGISNPFEEKFSDCSYNEVNALSAMEIIDGMGDGTFAPDAEITREQAAAILFRAAKFLGNKTIPNVNTGLSYSDSSAVSDWAVNSVANICAMGIMNGISQTEFAPQDPYTVEQAIATMLRLYECE